MSPEERTKYHHKQCLETKAYLCALFFKKIPNRIYSGDGNTSVFRLTFRQPHEPGSKQNRPLNTQNRQYKVHALIPMNFS